MTVTRAKTLNEALDVLDVVPLDFVGTTTSAASNPAFYTELPPLDHDDLPGSGPAERLRRSLLGRRGSTKVFLSGHVGSGKSTQISRLVADAAIQEAFTVILLRLEPQLAPFLDAGQLLFLIAGAIFEEGIKQELLTEGARWRKTLEDIDTRLNGDAGLVARQGKTVAECNLLFVKVSQELQLSEHRRRQFRQLGETEESLFLDLLSELTLDVERSLVERASHRSLLVLIDDLDKVRSPEQQRDIFDTNLPALMQLPFCVLYTVPTGIKFGANRQELRRVIEHLYPVRVLDKAPHSFDPERAFIAGSDAFFRSALYQRVEPALVDEEAIRLAAIYSGGVVREFFRFMWSATDLADYHKLTRVDARVMRAAVRDARLRESAGLLGPDMQALVEVHRKHVIERDEDRRYLDEGRVLECYNDRVWYEVNPLLWSVVKPGE